MTVIKSTANRVEQEFKKNPRLTGGVLALVAALNLVLIGASAQASNFQCGEPGITQIIGIVGGLLYLIPIAGVAGFAYGSIKEAIPGLGSATDTRNKGIKVFVIGIGATVILQAVASFTGFELTQCITEIIGASVVLIA